MREHGLCLVIQVVKGSDVLFLFGGLEEVRDTIKSIQGDLKDHQIIVPVTKDGNLDVFQVALKGSNHHHVAACMLLRAAHAAWLALLYSVLRLFM